MSSNNELSNEVERLKEKAQCIILECDKWKEHPENVFKFKYAQEKADGIIAILKRND